MGWFCFGCACAVGVLLFADGLRSPSFVSDDWAREESYSSTQYFGPLKLLGIMVLLFGVAFVNCFVLLSIPVL